MSATTYNAGVAARAKTNAAAVKTGKALKSSALCIVDFFKGFAGAELKKPARKPAAKKPVAAKRVVRRK